MPGAVPPGSCTLLLAALTSAGSQAHSAAAGNSGVYLLGVPPDRVVAFAHRCSCAMDQEKALVADICRCARTRSTSALLSALNSVTVSSLKVGEDSRALHGTVGGRCRQGRGPIGKSY